MFGWVKKTILSAHRKLWIGEATCPKCHWVFMHVPTSESSNWADWMKYGDMACPKCGHTFTSSESELAKVNPPGPFAKPANSRIELVAENGAWVFQIPRGYHPMGLGFISIFSFNVFAWFLSFMVVKRHPGEWIPAAILPITGLVLIFFLLRQNLTTSRLILGPQTITLRRKFLMDHGHHVNVAEITSVGKSTWYSRDYTPVYGIEITAGPRHLRFGTDFSDEEKNWLCWEIREFARHQGAPLES